MPTTAIQKPGGAPALRLRDVLARGLDVARRRFPFFLALTIIANLPTYLLYFLPDSPFHTAGKEPSSLLVLAAADALTLLLGPLVTIIVALPTPAGALYGLVALIGSLFALAALTHGVMEDSHGRAASIAGALSAALRRPASLIGVGLCSDVLRALATLFVAVPGIIVLCVLFVAVPVCAVEGLGVRASLARSAELTRGHRWTAFGVLVVIFLLYGTSFAVNDLLSDLDAWAATLIPLVWGAIAATFIDIFIAVFYVHLRAAAEGSGGAVARVFE